MNDDHSNIENDGWNDCMPKNEYVEVIIENEKEELNHSNNKIKCTKEGRRRFFEM